jgi:hypothetical protein
MLRPRLRNASSTVLAAVLIAAALPTAGCDNGEMGQDQMRTGSSDSAIPPMLEPNITRVVAFYDAFNPWLYSRDMSEVLGITISGLYLFGPGERGVFGDGIIRPRLYVLTRGENGQQVPVLVQEWAFDAAEAVPCRSSKPSQFGWGYRFDLLWDEALDLAGQQVRMVVSFERSDGIVYSSRPKDSRVRVPGGG